MNDSSNWNLSSTYFKQATAEPTCIGHGKLTEIGQVPAYFVLYKGKIKGRGSLTVNKKRRRSSTSKRYSIAQKEPWLLVTSLSDASSNPKLIVNIYRQRMRIEENIRDTKCSHYGLGLKESLTKCPQRMNILLLIAAIVTFIAWLAGAFVKNIGKAADFQAHSAKFNSVLSYVFLGRRALKKSISCSWEKFLYLLNELCKQATMTQREIYHYG